MKDVWLKHYLMHMGIKGQKWGIRNGPPYPLSDNQKSKEEKEQFGGSSSKKFEQRWKDYDILDPKSREIFHLSEGTKVVNREIFAGKGTKDPLKDEVAEGLSERIGGKPENWQHCKADAVIDYYGEDRKAEIHWFQEESVGKHKFKIKMWKDD